MFSSLCWDCDHGLKLFGAIMQRWSSNLLPCSFWRRSKKLSEEGDVGVKSRVVEECEHLVSD